MYIKHKSAFSLHAVICFMILFSFISCTREDTSPSLAGVYVAGYERVNGIAVAKYWKNGTEIPVTDGTRHAFAKSIFVTDQDIYVCGEEFNSAGARVAKYWKNGQPVDLGVNCYAESIVVSGNDVLVAGSEFSGGSATRAVYWKNGVINYLTSASTQGEAFAVTAVNTDIYVAGWERNNYLNYAKYWKNGTGTTLPGSSSIYSIAVAGTDVYVAGGESSLSLNTQSAYWKNGTMTVLGQANQVSEAKSIFISGTDVYAAGYEQSGGINYAVVWKNGIATRLSDGSDNATAQDIEVKNGDVYVAGYKGVATQRAVYWKNGTLVSLSNGSNNAYSMGMFVK